MPSFPRPATLSVVIPCYNEQATLAACVERVLNIADDNLSLEIIIVDDASNDQSHETALILQQSRNNIHVLSHEYNQGKGAALRSGFARATGEFVAVQDADLEYDPEDLKKLLLPLVEDRADVVFGSRYLYSGERRVLYFWHSLMNKCLTFVSNMFTDLGLTDMETCYKIFRRDIIKSIDIQENRFGFEPEIVAKVAQTRCRVYEAPISYRSRTYVEGKKIMARDGLRALYCILHYGAHKAPLPMQFLVYLFIGGASALINLLIFMILLKAMPISLAALLAFYSAAAFNYWLCVHLLFQQYVKWKYWTEQGIYLVAVTVIAGIDAGVTILFINTGFSPAGAKLTASALGLVLNFLARRFLVFPEPPAGPWK